MKSILYFELNTICVVVLLLLFRNLKNRGTMLPDQRLFRYLLLTAMLGLVMDTGTWCFANQTFPFARTLNMFFNTGYFIMTGIMCYLYLLYADFKIREDEPGLYKRMPWYSIPCIVSTFCAVLTPWTGWFFVLSEENVYTRGDLFWLQAALGWFYLVFPSFFSLRRLHKEANRAKIRECHSIMAFALFPLGSSALQTIYYGLALVLPSVTIALLMVFINLQNQQISLDALTGINNRGQLNKYLDICTISNKSKDKLYFVLIDVDEFKYINDTYGHAMGDAVLVRIAEVLKNVCGQIHKNDFLARYGGDEFAVICWRESEQDIEKLVGLIDLEIKYLSQTTSIPIPVSVSIGYSLFDPETMQNNDLLIMAADKEMYQHKKANGHGHRGEDNGRKEA